MPARNDILDRYFIDARSKLLDLAAFLDRVDRHPGDDDFRIRAFRATLPILLEDRPDRARAVLDALSDHSTEPLAKSPMQGAHGAPPPQSAKEKGASSR